MNTTPSLSLIFLAVAMLGGCAGAAKNRKSARSYRTQSLPSKGIKHTTKEEALSCKVYYKEHGNLELATKYLDQALIKSKDHDLRSDLILELADMHMELGNKDKASTLYAQYKTLYPGSSKIKYVLFQEILATYGEILLSSKDQTKTKEAIKLAQAYLEEFPDDIDHTDKVKDILEQSYIKLMRNELEIVSFYLQKYKYLPQQNVLKAAERRLTFLVKEYLPRAPKTEHLLGFSRQLQDMSERVDYTGLQKIVETLESYLMQYPEVENSFFSGLLTTRRHVRHSKNSRS